MGLWAFLRRDVQLLLADWKGLAMMFVLPVAVAAISGWAFSGMSGGDDDGPRLRVLLVDEDGSPGARKLVDRIAAIPGVGIDEVQAAATAAHPAGRAVVRELLRLGKRPAALLIPAGTGARLDAGLFAAAFNGGPPELELWIDPSRQAEVGMFQGALYRAAMEVVAADAFSPTGGRRQFDQWEQAMAEDRGMPPELREAMKAFIQRGQAFFDEAGRAGGGGGDGNRNGPGAGDRNPFSGGMPEPVRFKITAITAGERGGSAFAGYDGYAHAFAGMGVMFLLFGVLEGGLFLILERQRGTLARVVASPTPAHTVLVAQMLFNIALGVVQLCVMLLVAWLAFGVHVVGSWLGLACVVVAAAAAAAGFGLLIAALFSTERQARPVAILVILVTSALGGSWWPLFITPRVMQDLASVTITKWAVGGLEGALWRGWSFADMAPNAGILLAMAAGLFGLAWWRFRFE